MNPSALRILRIVAGLTQRDLAQLVHRTPTWISLAERGIEPLLPTDVERLAKALGVAPALICPTAPFIVAKRERRVRARA